MAQTTPFNYEASQLNRLERSETYGIKIVSDSGGETKWLTITANQLAEIRKILTSKR